MRFKALTIYGYYDGPTLFTAQEQADIDLAAPLVINTYLFRWEFDGGDEEDALLDRRVYKADGFDITIKEDEIDWSEAEA